MMSLLDQVRPLAKDHGLEHRSRLSVRADIERIRAALDSRRWPPGAVAIFSCSGRELYEEVPLRRRVREQVVVDATPFARPMLTVLSEYRRACVLVINKASARVWEVDSDEMREVTKFKDPVLRKPDYAANLAEDRVRNKEEELVKRHFRRAVKLLEDLQQTDGYDIVIIGGHDYEVPEFIQILPNELRNRVAGTFSVDPATAPLAEIGSTARSMLERYEREEEQRLVSEVLEKAATGRPAALGLESCLQAAPVAAIKTLLVPQGAIAPGVVCDESRWLAASGDICPVCGNPTRRTPDRRPGRASGAGNPRRSDDPPAVDHQVHQEPADRPVRGFGYTAFVIDAFAGLIAGWECSLSKETAFVERAIRQAAAWRARQGHPLGDGAIHHSDYAEPCVKPRKREVACAGGAC